jgi:glycine/D-amino acid oxidase-like deaminating enzyme
MEDYLVIGCGLAGIALCEELESRGYSYQVISDRSQQASRVAGGLYNPVILKRFSLAWQADRQMAQSIPLYLRLERKLGVRLDYALPIHRIFYEEAEKNRWFEALDDTRKATYMTDRIEYLDHPLIDNPYGCGYMTGTGRVDTRKLLDSYQAYLRSHNLLREESFDYDELGMGEHSMSYGGTEFRHVVFCEGYGLKRNPYFNYLPLVGTKGELLVVRIPGFNWTSILKSSVFAIPLGEDRYRLGATYKWKDKTSTPTEASRQEIEEKAGKFLKAPWEVVEQSAGVRPTVTDRRPLLGTHPKYDRLHVFNGLGSRGVLMAPYLSGPLVDSIEKGLPLDPEVDIRRFSELLPASD